MTKNLYYKKRIIKILTFILIIVASTDAIISVNYNWDITQIRNSFYEDYENKQKLLNYVKSINNETFYRIENNSILTFNDPAWYNYHGMETFSSMAYESMAKLQHYLGMPGNEINSYYYKHQTPIYDLMFDINYFVGENSDNKRYIELNNFNYDKVNLFLYNIGLGFGVNSDLKNWKYEYNNPLEFQNDFINKATNTQNVLVQYEPYASDLIELSNGDKLVKYTYKNTYDNMYFYTNSYAINYFIINNQVYYLTSDFDEYDLFDNEFNYPGYNSYTEKYIININSKDDNIVLYVKYPYENFNDNTSFSMYTIDENKFKEAYNYLINYKLNITDFKEDNIKAEIDLDDNMFVYTSINYDEGWQVYVDGKKVETFKLADSLLAFDAPKGHHNITFKYEAKGLKLGLIISSIGLIILITSTIITKRKKL